MSNIKCEYCDKNFENEDKLKKHIKISKTCNKYKNILFTCLKCKFKIQGIKNIDKHIDICDKNINIEDDNITYEVLSDDETILNKKKFEKEILKKLDIIIKNTKPKKKEIVPAMFSNFIDKEIEKKPNIIKKQNLLKDKDTNLSTVPFYIKDESMAISSKHSITSSIESASLFPSAQKSKKQFFKKLKCIELVKEETNDQILERIQNINKIYYENKEQYDELVKTNENLIKEIFDDIKQTQKINTKTFKLLDNIKNKRLELLSCMPLKNYYQILQKHLQILNNILKSKKDLTDKKIISIISKMLNSIDMRLVSYHNYVNYNLEIDEIQNFKSSLKFFNLCSEKFEIFDNESFFKKFHNYSLALFTIKDIFEIYIVNKYNFNNIIYIPLKNSTDADPYSFYYLEDIIVQNNISKKYWKMDCRLEELSNLFITNVRPFLIQFFRKLYYDVFNDNDYRKGYKTTNPITEYDCEQILQNIYILSKPKEFCMIVRNIVKKNCTYYPTENDRFNLHGDDTVQKKRLMNNKETVDIVEIIQCLFDNISSEDAVDFYRGIN